MERFDKAQEQAADPDPIPTIEAIPPTNGVDRVKKEARVKSETPASTSISASTPPTPSDDDHDSDAPPKKKVKKNSSSNKAMDDAQFAALLQAQENSKGRATRGGGIKKAKVVKKKTPKKKSAAKIKADDDSDVELNSDGEVKEKPKKGGFHKQYQLSEPLAQLVGESQASLVV
jgi:chromatin remodeling complex protein RSC6